MGSLKETGVLEGTVVDGQHDFALDEYGILYVVLERASKHRDIVGALGADAFIDNVHAGSLIALAPAEGALLDLDVSTRSIGSKQKVPAAL